MIAVAGDFRCSARRRALGFAVQPTCRRCGAGPCIDAEFAGDGPVDAIPRPDLQPAPESADDLLRDVAAYLGDRPQKDAEAMALYRRVLRMLAEGGENAGQ